MKEINLGDFARDKITGFHGIVTANVDYLTGCSQMCLQPQAFVGDDSKLPESHYFDIKRLAYVGPGINLDEIAEKEDPGGPNRDCPKH